MVRGEPGSQGDVWGPSSGLPPPPPAGPGGPGVDKHQRGWEARSECGCISPGCSSPYEPGRKTRGEKEASGSEPGRGRRSCCLPSGRTQPHPAWAAGEPEPGRRITDGLSTVPVF